MKKYEIWSEGFAATGERGGPIKHGEIEAENFQQACDMFFMKDKLYNSSRLTHWGCKLFDNLEDARKLFG